MARPSYTESIYEDLRTACINPGEIQIKSNNLTAWREGPNVTKIAGGKIISQDELSASCIPAASIIVNGKLGMGYSVLSTAGGSRVLSRNTLEQSLDVDFDSAVWRVSVPGVPREQIKVYTVKDRLTVDAEGYERLQFALAEGEFVSETKLELGILTITIDRPDKRVDIVIS